MSTFPEKLKLGKVPRKVGKISEKLKKGNHYHFIIFGKKPLSLPLSLFKTLTNTLIIFWDEIFDLAKLLSFESTHLGESIGCILIQYKCIFIEILANSLKTNFVIYRKSYGKIWKNIGKVGNY
jgi:hypothetical protein